MQSVKRADRLVEQICVESTLCSQMTSASGRTSTTPEGWIFGIEQLLGGSESPSVRLSLPAMRAPRSQGDFEWLEGVVCVDKSVSAHPNERVLEFVHVSAVCG